MSIASDVVKFAASELSKKVGKCENCQKSCKNNCKNCLEDIHMGRVLRRYNCHFMCSYYVISYLYKYKKEIRMAFINNKTDIKQHITFGNNFKIVSFGCGPGTELIGFFEYISLMSEEIEFNNLEIEYVGVDLNDIWENYFNKITQRVKEGFKSLGINFASHFYHADAFKFSLNNEKIDIVMLPYVLSEMYRFANTTEKFANTPRKMERLVKILFRKIKDKMRNKSLILCNDINHNIQARDHFDILSRQIDCLTLRKDFCFEQKTRFFKFGTIIEDTNIDNDFPSEIKSKYNVWENCSSAQSIFFLDKK